MEVRPGELDQLYVSPSPGRLKVPPGLLGVLRVPLPSGTLLFSEHQPALFRFGEVKRSGHDRAGRGAKIDTHGSTHLLLHSFARRLHQDADGRFDWAAPSEETHAFINELEATVGTYLYGRRMYETMVSWETDPAGAELAGHAFAAGLVDECHAFLAPAAVGGGKRALPDHVRLGLELTDQRRFESGMIYLRYAIGG